MRHPTRFWILTLTLMVGVLLLLGPEVAQAAAAGSGEAHGFDWGKWSAKVINAAIFFGAIFYFAFPILKEGLESRRSEIGEELAQAERASEEVAARQAEAEAALARLQEEARQIREKARTEAEAERTRILEDAQRQAERVMQVAEAQIQGALREARQDLRRNAAQLSAEMAEEIIRREINDQDKAQLFDEAVQSLEGGA